MLVSRYNNLAGLCSIAAGFSFDALIEIDFEEADELSSTLAVVKPAFYLSATLALALALYGGPRLSCQRHCSSLRTSSLTGSATCLSCRHRLLHGGQRPPARAARRRRLGSRRPSRFAGL